jgi:hypothetical protein
MKTAKRVLAVMIAVIMIVGTCAVAASAATTLQAQIDGGASTITLTKNTTETITVNGDITINLNGYRLIGEPGKNAIIVKGGNVTITDGQVISRFANVRSAEMLQTVTSKSPSAIAVSGGSVTLDGVRVVGGNTRIPTTQDYFLPTGSAVQLTNGATATLRRTSLYGRYGVNNNVSGGTAGGIVTIDDALVFGFLKAVKGNYTVTEGSEEIVAADRIAGVLNDGITLEPGEKELVDNFFDERVIIVTKTAEELTTVLDEDKPLVTKTQGVSIAEVEAPILDYTWKNTKGTDCSYRLVPEAIKQTDGTWAELDSVQADLVNEDCPMRYRVHFLIGDEALPYIESITKEGLDNPLDGVLGWAGEELNSYYNTYTVKNSNNAIDSYDEVIAELGDLMKTVDSLGNKTVKELLGLTDEEAAQAEVSGYIKEMEVYQKLQQKLYLLAGATGFNAKYPDGSYTFTEDTWHNIFGNTAMPKYVGTLDRVQELKDQLEEILGARMFMNTAAYGDLAVWAIETAYPALMTALDEAIERLTDLQSFLNEGDMADLVAFAGIQDKVALINSGVSKATKLKGLINDILSDGDAAAAVDYATAHSTEFKGYVNKAVEVIENWRTYVTPEKFLVNDEQTGAIKYVTTYSTRGPIEIEEIEGEGNLHITVNGRGTVAVATDVVNTTIDGEASLPFEHTFTLTGTPKNANYEFLFWVNKEAGGNGRILTSEPVFTMTTDLDRDIEAVFGRVGSGTAYFTNPTGDITFASPVVDNIAAVEETRPYVAGYGFVGWPNAGSDGVDLTAATTDYFTGNSAFATLNAYYGEAGANLFVRPGSSSYIITPVFSKNGGYTATFIDGEDTWVGKGNYSDIATHTAKNGNYWILDGTDKIVCVNPEFPYQMIDNPTFRSVAGECPVDTVTNTDVRVENGSAVFYIERSTKKAIKQVGMVYSFADSTPSFGEENCYLITAKNTNKTGLFAPSVPIAALGNATIYGVAYIEFADGTYYESPDVFQYPG